MTVTDSPGTDFHYDVGKLKHAALERGWTRYRVAKESGVTSPTVCKFFRGESVTETTVKKIADALGVPMSEIVVQVGSEITVPAEPALAKRKATASC